MKVKTLTLLILVFAAIACFNNIIFANENNHKNNEVLLHYWHFNDLPDLEILPDVHADFSLFSNIFIKYQGYGGGYMDRVDDGTLLNAESGFEGGYALRVRNPSNLRDIIIDAPTTGFKDIVLSYAVKRTTNGQTLQTIYYSTTEQAQWTLFEQNISITESYQLILLDFSDIQDANDNPYFKIKIVFGGETITGSAGNNRFDNVKVNGVPKEGTQTPPYFTEIIELYGIIESQPNTDIDLNELFIGHTELDFTVFSSDEYFVNVEVENGYLKLTGNNKGDAEITIIVNDGVNPFLQYEFRVMVYPQAHVLHGSEYNFNQWSPDMQDYDYPENMIFLQSDIADPDLDYELLYPYFIPHDDYNENDFGTIGFPYNNTRRTRINGLGNQGISFINTGRDRDLGGALLAINTLNVENVFLDWTGGTVNVNERFYGIRLQYRIGANGEFSDLLIEGNNVEYLTTYDGHFQVFANLQLPEELLGKEYVQILWKYHWIEGNIGPRAELRLDNINLKTTPSNVVEDVKFKKVNVYPNPARDFITIDFENNNSVMQEMNPVFEVYDALGQQVIVSKQNNVNVTNLNSGLYYVVIKINNEIVGREKFVVR